MCGSACFACAALLVVNEGRREGSRPRDAERAPRPRSCTSQLATVVIAVVIAVARGFGGAAEAAAPSAALAPSSEIDAALAHWDRALEAIDFYDTGHRDRSLRDWRALVASRPLTERDAHPVPDRGSSAQAVQQQHGARAPTAALHRQHDDPSYLTWLATLYFRKKSASR